MAVSKSFLAACLFFLHLFGSGECTTIMNQPEDRLNVLAGTDVTFSVSLDRGVLETDMFRWLFRGAPIADSTAGYTGLGTPDLTVVGVDSDDEGPYSVIITGEAFFLFSNGGILSILPTPEITAQPMDQLVIPAGTNAMFNVTATDAEDYQWQIVGTPPVNISIEDPGYMGADTASLTVLTVDSDDAAMYQCVVNNDAGPTTSNTAELTVLLPPTIDDQPTDANVAPDDTAIFTVVTSGEGLAYQWSMVVADGDDISLTNGGNVFGATSESLVITQVMEASHEGEMYYVTVTNDAGSVESSIVTITVVNLPVIDTHPESLSAQVPLTSVTFTVVVTGAGLKYQWLFDGQTITDTDGDGSKYSGTNSTILTVNNLVHPDDEGSYIVTVENAAGSVNSNPAMLDIVEPISILSHPESETVAVGESASFTVVATGDALTYQWRRGETNLDSANTAKYTGVTEATLVVMNAVDVDDEGAYSVVISNAAGGVTSNGASMLTILTTPLIMTEPMNQEALPGEMVTFSIVAMGDGLTYQWIKDEENILSTNVHYSGAQSATLTVVAAREPEDEGVYVCVAINAVGLDTSVEATLEITNCLTLDPAPTNGMIDYSTDALGNGGYSIASTATYNCTRGQLFNGDITRTCMNTGEWSGTAPECLDYCVPLDVVNGMVNYDLSVNSLTNYPSETVATHLCSANFGFTGGNTRTCMNSVDDSGVGSWSGSDLTCDPTKCPALNNVTNGQISYAPDNTTDFDVDTEATHTCDNGFSSSGNVVLTCTQANSNELIGVWDLPSPTCDLDPPMISNQPSDQLDINEGQNATFTVMASGIMLIYQWMKDGAVISDIADLYSGTMSGTLTVESVDASDEGEYTVSVMNTEATVVSMPVATLTVLLVPTITTEPLDMCIAQGNSFTLTVVASSRSLNHQWFLGSPGNGTQLVEGGEVSGATSDELTITAAVETAMYYVIVTNDAGSATSVAATVTIVTAPSIDIPPSSTTNQIPGDNIMFTVTASAECGGLTYQWFMGENMLTNGDKYTGATTNNLTVIDIIHPDDEGAYTVMVTSLFSTVESSVADLDIVEPISITSQPMDTTVAIGATANFTVMADGDSPFYQWMLNGNPIAETPLRFIGATMATLMVMNVVEGDGGMYSVMVTNAASPSPGIVSETVTLTALVPINITTPPADEFNVVPGTNVVFTCDVNGDSPSYQWRKDGVVITNSTGAFEGATTFTLTVIDARADDVGLYSCVVSNAVSTQTSAEANLQLSPEFAFSASVYNVSEGDVNFMVQITFISGFINAELDIVLATSNATAVNTADTFGCMDYTSTTATLTFNVGTEPGATMTLEIPINDDNCVEMDETFGVSATAASFVRFSSGGDSAVVTITDNDMAICDFSSDPYTVNETSLMVGAMITLTANSGVLTFPIVLTLSDAGGGSATNGGDEADFNLGSPAMTVPAGSGPFDSISFDIEIVNDLRDEPMENFNIQATADSNRATFVDGDNTAEVQITDDDVCLVGLEMTKYNVSEDLATVEVCLVKINNVILASAIIMRVSTGDVVADNDVDSAEANNDYTRQDNIALNFGPSDTRSCISIPINNEELEEMTENFGVFFTSESPESLDFMEGQDNAEVCILNDDENCLALSSITNGIPISYLPIVLANGQYLIDTVATYSCSDGQLFNGDTTRTCMNNGEWNGTAPVCLDYCPLLPLLADGMITYDPVNGNMNDNFPAGATANFECNANYTLMMGSERTCMASNVSSLGSWSGVDAVCQLDGPEITDQPDDQLDIIQGMNATFTVAASGLTLTYQWFKDGVSISDTADTYIGTQSETLTVLSVMEPEDNGTFTVTVTNPTSSVTSVPAAMLTVLAPPTIDVHPIDNCVTNGSTATFSVEASGRLLAYQWFKFLATSDDVEISGEEMATLTVTGVMDEDIYYVVVSNAAGQLESNQARSIILTAPSINMPPSNLADQIPGTDVMFTVTASAECGNDLTYQWFMGDSMLTDGDKYGGVNNDTLTVMNIVHPDDEGSYSVQVTNAAGTSNSTVATLDIVEPISITSQPMNTTVAIGATANFTVMAVGDSPLYQWRFNGNPITETPLKFIGATMARLMVVNVTSGDGGMYSVMVTNAASLSPDVVSDPATLTALLTPEITTDPADELTVQPGDDVMFTCGATGDDLVYAWLKDSVVISDQSGVYSGAMTPTLTVIDAQEQEDEGSYACMVSNTVGDDTSESATLEIVNCEDISASANGDIGFSMNRLTPAGGYSITTVATYNCSVGQLFNGNTTRTCMNTGEWSGTAPVCLEYCTQLTLSDGEIDYSNDANEQSSFEVTTTATYSCDTEFNLEGGVAIRTCISTDSPTGQGNWNGSESTCEPTCTLLSAPADGGISYNPAVLPNGNFNAGTEATFSCDSDFDLFGSTTSTCQGDHTWDNIEPTCQRVCPPLDAIDKGTISYAPNNVSMNGNYTSSTVATYTCNTNYGRNGNATRTCGDDSLWSGEAPACELIMCEDISDPENGNIVFETDTTATFDVLTKATYSCDSGYSLQGSDVVRNCTGTVDNHLGTFNGVAPTCEPIMCAAPSAVSQGTITYKPVTIGGDMYSFGTVATVACSVGLFPVEPASSTCGGDGSSTIGVFEPDLGSCEAVTCFHIPPPLNGHIDFAEDNVAPFDLNTVATYSCESGFALMGNETRTCTINGDDLAGVWSVTEPSCIAITCAGVRFFTSLSVIYDLAAVSTDVYSFGTEAMFSCDEGLDLVGSPLSTCKGLVQAGEFTPRPPWCFSPITLSLSLLNNTTTEGDDVTACVDFSHPLISPVDVWVHFILPFSPPIPVWFIINTTGEITSQACQSLYAFNIADSIPDGNNVIPDDDADNGDMVVAVFAEVTMTPSDSPSISVNPSIALLTILDDDFVTMCPDLSDPTNGQIVYADDTQAPFMVNTTATYSCAVGFTLQGFDKRTCVGSSRNGMWSGTEPSCEADPNLMCAALPVIDEGNITYSPSGDFLFGVVAMYICDEGFGIYGGNRMRTCSPDLDSNGDSVAMWDGTEPECIPIMCPDIPDPDNGQITFTTDNTAPFEDGTMALYSCNSGYVLSDVGNNPRMCGGDGSSSVGAWSGAALTCITQIINAVPIGASRLSQGISSDFSVSFDQSSYEVNEGASDSVCVVVSGSLESQLSVQISTTEDTAKVSKDYTDLKEELKFDSAGQKCIDLVTLGDSVYEGDEKLSVSLSYSQSSKAAIVTIKDDDQAKVTLSASSVCEGAGSVTVRVQLDSDIETDVIVSLETSDLTAKDSDDYNKLSQDLTFTAPLTAPSELTVSVVVNDDNVLEPCEDFLVSLSSTDEGVVFDPAFLRVQINDDEDVSDFSLTHNSPQISGKSLNATFELKGCAELTCRITHTKDSSSDCSPAPGSYKGNYFISEATNRKTCQDLIIKISAHCEDQKVPSFKNRSFRTDHIMCGVHFTDQQYEYDPVSGDVTVEWEGTGPDETNAVSEFKCKIDNEALQNCTSPFTIQNLTSGSHTIAVYPVGPENVDPKCEREIGKILKFEI